MTLRGKTVLVTGATGFLGGALVRRLSADGVRVRASARPTSDTGYVNGLPLVEIVIGDITERSSAQRMVEGCDYVIHAAAALRGDLTYQTKVNVSGTHNIAEAAAKVGVERLVHVSSIAYYGYNVDGDIHEDTPPAATRDPYARTKAEAEARLAQVAEKRWLSYNVIRPGMIYGERSNVWTGLMFRFARRKPTLFIGSGQGHAHPIHVDDVVDMCVRLATASDVDGQAFNCTPDPAPTWREFIGEYSKLAGHQSWLGVPAPLATLGMDLRAALAPKGSSDAAWGEKIRWMQRPITYRMGNARDMLNWQPAVSLSEGIAASADWLREQGLLQA